MKIEIDINTDNAAFQEDERELQRILLETVAKIKDGETDGYLKDYNGNRVGEFNIN